MIPLEKFEEVLQKLLERSQKGEVEWKSYDDDTNTFGVSLPQSTLTIKKVSPRTDPDYYSLELFNNEGVRLISLIADEGDVENHWFPVLAGLFSEAFRCRTGWDKVLAEFEAAVSSESHVGIPY